MCRRILWGIAALMFIISFLSAALPKDNSGSAAPNIIEDAVSDTRSIPVVNTKEAISSDGREKFVAHRGYSAAAPENTALAFELAGKAAFWGIETDISETYDNEFICMHDDTLDRTTDGSGNINEYSYAALRNLTITEGANLDLYPNLKIPSMVEYLNICVTYGCVPIIEIKKIADYDKFLRTIYDSNVQDKCIIVGAIEDLTEIRARDKDIMLMVIGYSNTEYTTYFDLISRIDGERGILYNYPVITEQVVEEAHQSGLVIGAWSLDTAEEAQMYMDYGVDYVVTNEIPGGTNLMINTTE